MLFLCKVPVLWLSLISHVSRRSVPDVITSKLSQNAETEHEVEVHPGAAALH